MSLIHPSCERSLLSVDSRWKLKTLTVTLMLSALAGCTETPGKPVETVDRGPIATRRPIESLRMDRGLTARSVLACPKGECIVLHFPVRFIQDPGQVEIFFNDLKMLLTDRPDSTEDDGEVLSDQEDHWSNERRLGGTQATYNCCTYAVGEVAGLTKSDWISPNPIDATDYKIPMKVLLDSYYQAIFVQPIERVDWHQLESDSRFEDGDVFCYVRLEVKGESVGLIQEFTHAGKILRKNGRNWLVSKLGMGPIVRSGLGITGKLFHGEFDQIRVYRRLAPTAELPPQTIPASIHSL